ncbi:MAG: group II truncated hemoglobin [Solirubrobacterales bacterium]|nr:group II truncated hemoglobin [Solirubrobacterales bacterium]
MSLYQDAGGREGLLALSRTFYDKVLADKLLAPVFANFTPTHVDRVAIWLAEVFEGPTTFTDELGGHHFLLERHLGLGITEPQRQRWLELMSAAIDNVYGHDLKLHAPLMAYFDWGTKIAQDVSQSPVGTDLGSPGPTPRWGYDGLK